jgi:DtxR family Mn-dependent transcriptional regulator
MELEEKAEEILETLWIETSEKKREGIPLAELGRAKRPLEQLEKAGYISHSDDQITLTAKGRPEARSVVRRHRLAERLLHDVLGTGEKLMHDKACKFEHLLDKGLDESICHLLGHPKICPHGKPIPPGRCCRRGRNQVQKLVSPLSQLAQGQGGKVAYIYAPETSRLQKLMAMGILPGAPVSLVQSFPSYVFTAGQTQFAVDKDIADAIYVRLVEDEAAPPEEAPPRRRRGKGFGLWGRRRQDS